MSKVAVFMAEGFEESETILIVDILRRLEIECHTISLANKFVRGMNDMYIKSDLIAIDNFSDYDMIVLPGGRPGGDNLCNSELVIKTVRDFNNRNKYIAAMCSGTTVLAVAQVLSGKKVTGYTGYEEKLIDGIFVNDVVVSDMNLITSQGPATAFPFAFRIAEVLGKDTSELRSRLMYDFAGGK